MALSLSTSAKTAGRATEPAPRNSPCGASGTVSGFAIWGSSPPGWWASRSSSATR